MKSSALLHFPQVRWHGQEKRLWNRVWRRSCKDLPEERVRLQMLDWLLLQQEWPAGYIASEQALPGTRRERTDLLCYDSDGEPSWLIECKAPNIKLDESASIQIARYNRDLQAPYLCLTNGVEEKWFHVRKEGLEKLNQPPKQEKGEIQSVRSGRRYWIERGFIGHNDADDIQEQAASLCRSLYHPDHSDSIFHLGGSWRSNPLSLSHYYRRIPQVADRELAVALLADPDGASWISALHHRNGRTDLMIQTPIQTNPETGALSGAIHFHRTDRRGSMPLDTLPLPPLTLEPDSLIPGLLLAMDHLLEV